MGQRLFFICWFGIVVLFWVSSTNVTAAPDRNTDEWKFSLSPLFLWGMNIDGTATVGRVAAPLDLNFKDDVFENLSAVFTLHFEAYKGNLSLFAEYQYVDLDPTTTIPNGPAVDVDFTIQAAEFGGGYIVAEWWGNTTVEPIIGVRYAYQDLTTQVVNGPRLVDTTEDWWDVFGGIRLWTRFNEKWTTTSRADIGAGGSNFVWNVSFKLDYQFKEWGSVFLGYRWLDYDYDEGSGADRYAYDALQQGPLAGITFYW